MASIFEDLMDANRGLTESVKTANRNSKKKKVCEHKKISIKNLKVESRKIFEETDFDELDQEFAAEVTDENPDEVVLVIDPELPSDEDVPEDAAQDMIGDLVYKCPVCGSNYVCDCESAKLGEGIEVDEEGVPTECPICGDDASQILIGEISPADGAGEETEMEPVDSDDFEDIDDEEFNESFNQRRGRSTRRRSEACKKESDNSEEDPKELLLDDEKLESLMSEVVKENYKGNPYFKVTRCSIDKSGKLKIEYFVRENRRKVTKGVLVGEGFNRNSRKMKIKFSDKGAFTESFSKSPAFIVECIKVRNVVAPVSINYDYKVRFNESLYRVSGTVGKSSRRVNESKTSQFLELHDDPEIFRKDPSVLDKVYSILGKYGDDSEDVDVVFNRATPQDQDKMINLLLPLKESKRSSRRVNESKKKLYRKV